MSKSGFIVAILAIAFLIFSPVIVFCCGWFGGWILSKIAGLAIVSGFNMLFNTDRFVVDMIPIVCGTLAVIGSYFKTSISNNK